MLGACGASSLNRGKIQPRLTISAAASLQNVLLDIEPLYYRQHPQVTISFNFGSSGALQHQIEHGAPVDLFISAASRQLDILERKNLLLDGTRRSLLRNQVVLVTSPRLGFKTDFYQLASERISSVAIGHPESVPAGDYAKEVLMALNLYERISDKLVFGKDVRQVLTYVETGNVDAGLVYATDAKISDRVVVVATAQDTWHSSIIYPAAAISTSRNPDLADTFVQFLATSHPAQQLFATYGFLPA